jgi:hypothetical protein
LGAKLQIIARKNKQNYHLFHEKGLFYTISFRKSPISSDNNRLSGGVQIGEIYTPNCRLLYTIVDFCTSYYINI